MLEINDNTILEKQQGKENIIYEWRDDQLEEKSAEEIQVIKKVKEIGNSKREEKVDEKIAAFLQGKDLSENLIKTLINTSLTDEHIRTLNLNDDDMENLQDLSTKIKISKNSDINSIMSDGSSSDGRLHLSLYSDYLRKALSKPLIQALCEIVAKKPVDPVEYLGHWLLHFKICEQRTMQQKELEFKVLTNKEKSKLKLENKEDLPIERKEEEEFNEDWNYPNYGEL